MCPRLVGRASAVDSSVVAFLAQISISSHLNGLEYDADGMTTAFLAVNSASLLLFIILSVLCSAAIGVTRGPRLPHLTLLAALSFNVIQTSAMVASCIISSDNGSVSRSLERLIVATWALEAFCGNWALLSFCLLLKDRFATFKGARALEGPGHAARLDPAWTKAFFAWFILLVAFGATAAALYTSYISVLFLGGHSSSNIMRLSGRFQCIFDALWYTSAFLVGSLALHVYKTMRRIGTDDITKLLLYGAFPLYVCLIIQNLAFTILFSPLGIGVWRSIVLIQKLLLMSAIFENGLYAAIALSLILCGLRLGCSGCVQAGEEGANPSRTWQPTSYHSAEEQPLLHEYDSDDPLSSH